MPLAALVCFALLGCSDDANPPAGVADEYRQVKAASGRTPDDQIRLALWCEAHGLTAERMRHLALAVLADPTNATARGLSGLVARDGRWLAPDSVAQSVRTDPTTSTLLAEYDTRRSRTPYNADAQWALGLWADEQGLKDQAKAHYTAVTRLDPIRTLGGVATVEAVSPEAVQPVFNLEVAEGRSFFVGRLGALVHDNSLVEATPNPFDAARPKETVALTSATITAIAAPQ